jgi:hypothetical protein
MRNITNVVITNPLNGFVTKSSDLPSWVCKHPGAKIINHEKKMYRCDKCRKLAIIKIIPQMSILNAISENQPPS